MHIYRITPLLHVSASARRNVYIFACASCWSCKMNYISLHRMNNIKISDNVCTGRNSMLKYIHRGYVYKCKRIYIYSAGFNIINYMGHRTIIIVSTDCWHNDYNRMYTHLLLLLVPKQPSDVTSFHVRNLPARAVTTGVGWRAVCDERFVVSMTPRVFQILIILLYSDSILTDARIAFKLVSWPAKIGRENLTFPISEEILDSISSAALPTETFLCCRLRCCYLGVTSMNWDLYEGL
jgi:hypothetical protein